MTKLSAKIIEETLDYEDVTPKKEKGKSYSVQHYIGTFTESQLKSGAGNDIIYSLQDSQHFPDLKRGRGNVIRRSHAPRVMK